MPLYMVRHAKAGTRSAWVGPDEARPLSRAGREQAERITELLVHEPAPRVLSSPYRRCVETLEPLAVKLGVPVEVVDALEEGAPVEPLVELMTALPDHTVLCSHGDI